jgi:hypothetical protein
MKITIFPGSKKVKVGTTIKRLHDFDWSPFAAVHAVQADVENDRAEIEFVPIDPDGPGPKPSVKPQNELVDITAFRERFGAILEAFDAVYIEDLKKPNPASHTHTLTTGDGKGGKSEFISMAARLDRLEQSFAILFEEVGKARGQG